jgi:hypothetical protein
MLTPKHQPPSDDELIATVRRWLNQLGDGHFVEACSQLDEPNTYGVSWTPEDVMRAARSAFAPQSRFSREHPEGPVFSRVDTAVGDGHPTVVAFADGSGYSVEHQVPLNGSYSDLTVQTEFRWRGRDLAFILHDLHVL